MCANSLQLAFHILSVDGLQVSSHPVVIFRSLVPFNVPYRKADTIFSNIHYVSSFPAMVSDHDTGTSNRGTLCAMSSDPASIPIMLLTVTVLDLINQCVCAYFDWNPESASYKRRHWSTSSRDSLFIELYSGTLPSRLKDEDPPLTTESNSLGGRSPSPSRTFKLCVLALS